MTIIFSIIHIRFVLVTDLIGVTSFNDFGIDRVGIEKVLCDVLEGVLESVLESVLEGVLEMLFEILLEGVLIYSSTSVCVVSTSDSGRDVIVLLLSIMLFIYKITYIIKLFYTYY